MKRKKGEPTHQNSTEPTSDSSVSTSTNINPQNNFAQLEINKVNLLMNPKERRHSEAFSINSNLEHNETSANNVSYYYEKQENTGHYVNTVFYLHIYHLSIHLSIRTNKHTYKPKNSFINCFLENPNIEQFQLQL